MEEKIITKGVFSKFNVLPLIPIILSLIFVPFSVFLISGGVRDEVIQGIVFLLIAIVMVIVAIIFVFWMKGCQLFVSDKKVYGKTSFGRSVSLPIDSVSAVSKGLCKSLSVSTSSGRITFWLMTNRDEVSCVIDELLLNRQSNVVPTGSQADDLKKYKSLLDEGIITQEEFDAKKKQLLGL